jgi:hypothetical protein
MTRQKKKEPSAAEEPRAQEEATVPEEPGTTKEEPTTAGEAGAQPEYRKSDLVKVRFTGELGILAGKAVYRNEVHQVRYWQYLEARETGGEAYELVEE